MMELGEAIVEDCVERGAAVARGETTTQHCTNSMSLAVDIKAAMSFRLGATRTALLGNIQMNFIQKAKTSFPTQILNSPTSALRVMLIVYRSSVPTPLP